MSFDVFDDVNWLAILVATVAYWILGAIWYARPVFGRAWQRASGTELADGYRPGPALYIGTLVSNFLLVVATAGLAAATGSTNASHAIVLGVVVGHRVRRCPPAPRGDHRDQAAADAVVRHQRRVPPDRARGLRADRHALGLI